MRRRPVILFLLILSCLAHEAWGQITDTSSLYKYTYLLYGKTRSGRVVQASGFLVKKNNQVYLVTACHVINGWHFESFEKEDSYPDTLFLRVNIKNTDSSLFIPIDISKIKNIKSQPDWPDVYFYRLTLNPILELYTIDALIVKNEPAASSPEHVLVYGFQPGELDFERSGFLKLKPQKTVTHFPDKDAYACSPMAYEVSYSGNTLGPGNSGSPVFFLSETLANGKKTLKVLFGGLLFAGNPSLHRASVIRPEVIKNLLMALK